MQNLSNIFLHVVRANRGALKMQPWDRLMITFLFWGSGGLSACLFKDIISMILSSVDWMIVIVSSDWTPSKDHQTAAAYPESFRLGF